MTTWVEAPKLKAGYDEHQARDPHTGQWVEEGGLRIALRPGDVEWDTWGFTNAIGTIKDSESYPGFGNTVTGRQLDRGDLDSPVYHVTVHRTAVENDGYLTVGKGGGLGAFGSEQQVSFTTDKRVAERLVEDLRTNIRLAKAVEDPPPHAEYGLPPRGYPGGYEAWIARQDAEKAKREEWGRRFLAILDREAERQGWGPLSGIFNDEQIKVMAQGYNWRDWLTQFYGHRPEEYGGNPVIIGLERADQASRDPNEVGMFELRPEELFDTGALVIGLGEHGLHEIRVYGDVPIKRRAVKVAHPRVKAGYDENQPRDPHTGRWIELVPFGQARHEGIEYSGSPPTTAGLGTTHDLSDEFGGFPVSHTFIGDESQINRKAVGRAIRGIAAVPTPVQERLAENGVTVRLSSYQLDQPADGLYRDRDGTVGIDVTGTTKGSHAEDYVAAHEMGHAIDMRLVAGRRFREDPEWQLRYEAARTRVRTEHGIDIGDQFEFLFEREPVKDGKVFRHRPLSEWFADVVASTVLNKSAPWVSDDDRRAMRRVFGEEVGAEKSYASLPPLLPPGVGVVSWVDATGTFCDRIEVQAPAGKSFKANFNPNQPRDRLGRWTRRLFHAAPTSARASIEEFGIDPDRSDVPRFDPSDPSAYGFQEPGEARWYATYMANESPVEKFDVWAYPDPGEGVFPDPGLGSYDRTSAVGHAPIPPGVAKLVATYDPGSGWTWEGDPLPMLEDDPRPYRPPSDQRPVIDRDALETGGDRLPVQGIWNEGLPVQGEYLGQSFTGVVFSVHPNDGRPELDDVTIYLSQPIDGSPYLYLSLDRAGNSHDARGNVVAKLRTRGLRQPKAFKYREDQARAPRGTPEGGRWIDETPGLPSLPDGFELEDPVTFPNGYLAEAGRPPTVHHAFNDERWDPSSPPTPIWRRDLTETSGHLVLVTFPGEDADLSDTEWRPFEDWIYEVVPEEYLGDPKDEFNKDFWAGVDPRPGSLTLYHGTMAQQWQTIKDEGLKLGDLTHGRTNQYQGPAVYATHDRNHASLFAWGSPLNPGVLVEIDMGAMKRDGFTPFLHGETPLMRVNLRDSIAWMMGEEDFHDDGADYDGIMPETVVIREDIPPKYLTAKSGTEDESARGRLALNEALRR